MARTYAESVKLPHLVSVPHPKTKYLQKNVLNVEGRKSLSEASFCSISSSNSRKSYITALIETDEYKKLEKNSNKAQTNCEQIMNLINDKLTTGYHGVKHLFKSNEINNGRLTKEAFKCALNQLCGYISNDAWNKVCIKFNLNERETISFDEFISYFRHNQKVRRELASSSKNLDIVDLNAPPVVTLQNNQSTLTPELSATYCFALIKAKANQSNFNPADHLPTECFKTNGLVMPFHLRSLLDSWNLGLSETEFTKLWERFDLKNVGGVKLNVFLRLINYRPNHVDELAHTMDMVRTKSCIVDKLNICNPNKKTYSYIQTPKSSRLSESLVNKSVNNHNEDKEEDNEIELSPVGSEEKKEEDEEPKSNLDEIANLNKDERAKKCESSLSERRIKSMVQVLKHSNKFGPNNDLIAYLNSKLNEGYILLKTAFEYIDPDHLGYLLPDEFRIVLTEFSIHMDQKVYDGLIKKYDLLKHGKLVDYQKFLKAFQEQRQSNSKTDLNKSVQSTDSTRLLNQIEKQIFDFFHSSYFNVYSYFSESIGDKENTCSQEMFKKLIEKSYSIMIDPNQFENLLEFLDCNKNDESKIAWNDLFKKFSDIDPWKNFKESCDRSIKSKRSKSEGRSLSVNSLGTSVARMSSSKSAGRLKENDHEISLDKIEEKSSCSSLSFQEEDNKYEEQDEQDPEIENVCKDTGGGDSSDEDRDFKIKNYFKSLETGKSADKFAEIRKNFNSEVKIIKKLEKKVENLLRTKFHSVNKVFSLIDSNHTEKIDKEKLRVLLYRCKLDLNQSEIDLLWKDFDADFIPFSNFIRRFFIPDEFDQLRNVKFKIELENKIKEDSGKKKLILRKAKSEGTISSSIYMNPIEREPTREKIKVRNLEVDKNLIEKMKLKINDQWNDMKIAFQKKDKHFKACVPIYKAMEVFEKFNIQLSDEEFDRLFKDFDINRCDFDYVRFLKHLKSNLSAIKKTGPIVEFNNVNPIMKQIILKLRDNNQSESPPDMNRTEADLKNLKNIFKKYDSSRKGYLNQDEFKNLLAHHRIAANLDDMYSILAEFDPNLKGIFCYNLFIKSLIEKMI